MITMARTIERVPFLLVDLLERTGKLPRLPPAFEPDPQTLGFRKPTFDDARLLTWVMAWDGPHLGIGEWNAPAGMLSYQDTFDWHSSSDVRKIEYLAGSARAVRDLLIYVRDDALLHGKAILGSIDVANEAMADVLAGIGGSVTRNTFEYRGGQ